MAIVVADVCDVLAQDRLRFGERFNWSHSVRAELERKHFCSVMRVSCLAASSTKPRSVTSENGFGFLHRQTSCFSFYFSRSATMTEENRTTLSGGIAASFRTLHGIAQFFWKSAQKSSIFDCFLFLVIP